MLELILFLQSYRQNSLNDNVILLDHQPLSTRAKSSNYTLIQRHISRQKNRKKVYTQYIFLALQYTQVTNCRCILIKSEVIQNINQYFIQKHRNTRI
jgi:hypothetical protein